MRYRRDEHRTPLFDIDTGDLAVMHELHGDLGTVTVHPFGEFFQRRDIAVV